MEVGIFSKTFAKYPLEEAFYRIKSFGIRTAQFNFANVGLNSLPDAIDDEVIERIKNISESTGISIPVVSGTFNTLELQEEKHRQNMKNFAVIVGAAAKLNIPYVSISTGSFNQADFWSPHPNNHTEEAWTRLYQSLDEMIKIASDKGVTIVVEPEQSNVVSTVDDTLKLIRHYNSPNLKVLFDAANIVTTADEKQLENKISSSLKQLSEYIAIAHCKDCKVTADKIEFAPVGKGNLPLKEYLSELRKYYHGPVIMHGLDEEDVAFALTYLEEK